MLPRHWSEEVIRQQRGRSFALRDFLDLLAQRAIGQFALAGAKYRPHRAAEAATVAAARPAGAGPGDAGPIGAALLALTGHGTPHLAERLEVGSAPLMHYARLFATWSRAASRLASLISDWVSRPVEVRQFIGTWLPLAPTQRTRLAAGIGIGQFARLGVDAAIGTRARDTQGRIVLRLGPVPRAEFEALLPGRPTLRRLVSLVRAFVGQEMDFAVKPGAGAGRGAAAATHRGGRLRPGSAGMPGCRQGA